MKLQNDSQTDRIEKTIELRATRSRVWQAITTAEQFGTWFRVKLDGEFAPGETVRGQILVPGFEHVKFEATVKKMEPEHTFHYSWHPYAVDVDRDYSKDPETLVAFTLEESHGGTLLRVVESGFDSLPDSRRDEAFRMNSNGWPAQLNNIAKHVGG